MRLANLDGRATLVVGGAGVDLAEASGGRFGPDVQPLYERWAELRSWADDVDADAGRRSSASVDVEAAVGTTRLGSPVPAPRQVFGIGLNYRSHAEESDMEVPSVPATFTKFPASLTGPYDDVALPGDTSTGRSSWSR